MSDRHQSKLARKPSISYHFLAGLVSGVFSAVLLQPADLLKTRLQQSGSSSLLVLLRDISSSPNTISRFWRGTTASVLRTGLGSAIYFPSLHALRQNVAKFKFLQSSEVKQEKNRNHSSTLQELSNVANLVTGSIARASAGFILMPMTVIKVRFESNLYAYKSIPGAGLDILKTEGIRGFFAGVSATTARDAPYAGLYILLYEQFKKKLSGLTLKFSVAGDNSSVMNGPRSASVNFASGMLAAGLATAITNPFDAIKTRIQLQPMEYSNLFYASRKMMLEEGLKSFFGGLGLRIVRKALSSALAWTLYEEVIRRVSPRWEV